MSNLQHIKGSRTKVLNTFPVKDFGNDGDIVISRIKGKGVFLCSKAGGMWYAANQMEELKKVGKARADSLSVNKLQINDMLNAESLSDKFLINENGTIKYRTGEQVVGDLSLPFDNISYKTAYCSLGQYSDKDSCESNGGNWYYSENDSHDSVSSTPENQLLTVGQSIGTVDAESKLLYNGSTLEIKYDTDFDDNWQTEATSDLLKLTYDSDKYGTIGIDSDKMKFNISHDGEFWFTEETSTGSQVARVKINTDTGALTIINPDSALDYFAIDVDDNAVTTIKTLDFGTGVGHLFLIPDGHLILDPASQKVIINATDGLYFDGGGDTYIAESSADVLDIKVGNDMIFQITESGTDGNTIDIDNACIGFTQREPIYDATITVVDFRHSNKQNLTFGSGNITNIALYFPKVSGNFQLLIKQDGTGSRTVTNYKVYEFDESYADGASAVKFAGGSNPTLTTDANHVDIISFYWDADNEIAYGVATLDFQF